MHLRPSIVVVPTGLGVAGISLASMYLHVESLVSHRLQYQSWVPWFIGIVLALALGWRPMVARRSWVARSIVRSLVLTLLLAPIPYGPEGTLVPAFLAMLFPPLIMLFYCPVGPLLTFFGVLGIVASYESLASEKGGTTEPGPPSNSHGDSRHRSTSGA